MSKDRAQIIVNYCNSSGPTNEQEGLRLDVLSCYLCPLKCGDLNSCPFGHSPGDGLRKLPTYICVNYLLARCKNCIVSADPSQCSDGFHPAVEDLIDLDVFNQNVALRLLSLRLSSVQPLLDTQSSSSFGSNKRSRSNSALNITSNNTSYLKAGNASNSTATKPEEDDPNECAICYENPRTRGQHFGLLEMCSHVFCAPCLTSWITSPGDQKACPMCRVYSSRSIIWPESRINSKEVKRQIFDYNLSCVRVYQQNHSTVAHGVDQGAVNDSQGTAPRPDFGLTVRIPEPTAQRTHQHGINAINLAPIPSAGPQIPTAGSQIPTAGWPIPTSGSQLPTDEQSPISSEQEYYAYRNRLIQRSLLSVQGQYGPLISIPRQFQQQLRVQQRVQLQQLQQQLLLRQQQQIVPLPEAFTGDNTNVNIIRNQQQIDQIIESFNPAYHCPSHTGQTLGAMPLNPNATPYQPLNHYQQQQQQQQQPSTNPQHSDLMLRLLSEG